VLHGASEYGLLLCRWHCGEGDEIVAASNNPAYIGVSHVTQRQEGGRKLMPENCPIPAMNGILIALVANVGNLSQCVKKA
jgi:hypothetical protein